MIHDKPLELITKCNYCKIEIPDEGLYYKHPQFGIVCEYCEPFKDGGITPIDMDDDGL